MINVSFAQPLDLLEDEKRNASVNLIRKSIMRFKRAMTLKGNWYPNEP